MDDNTIIRLYWDRDDRAITATGQKYGAYCTAIAKNILKSSEDAEECVNDTYLNAWNSMPPHHPAQLAAYLGKITRNLAFNRYRQSHTKKRGSGEAALILEELADCVSGKDDVEHLVDRKELARAINDFIKALPAKKQALFVRRYWYADSISKIAGDVGMSHASVAKTLERTRKQLKNHLTERGFEL